MKNSNEMTNEEIWKMLKDKMEKNNLIIKVSYIEGDYLSRNSKVIHAYAEDDVRNAIAIAYRSGYERAMKGRPFKFGDKKKGGYWKPVDSKNLPKEGAKVRYARKHPDYIEGYIKIGDTGVVQWEGIFKPDWLRIKLDNPRSGFDWFDFSGHEDCLDEWIEVI